jgi:hypothetical protein
VRDAQRRTGTWIWGRWKYGLFQVFSATSQDIERERENVRAKESDGSVTRSCD